jgi:methyl-accepting chemotaxis protein
MVSILSSIHRNDASYVMAALRRSLAVIEFDLDGTVKTANQNFLNLLGYTLSEVAGHPHSMFMHPQERDAQPYREFWNNLRQGRFQRGQFRRVCKRGSDIWIEATYNPILDGNGRPYKVVKLATDVTADVLQTADMRGQMEAISRSNMVIEFALDGTIMAANANFLAACGYTLGEIVGKHHSMFMDHDVSNDPGYRQFWAMLNQGEFQASQFRRLGKNGRVLWMQASYSVILDPAGRALKVVKYATDITQQVQNMTQLKTQLDNSFDAIDTAIAASRQQAESAAGAVNVSSASMQAMATSAEQLSASVREIAGAMSMSRAATDTVEQQRLAADTTTQKLQQTSTAMGGIVDLIRNIAGQVNLLALNATIESARAGEAGRGFAVVAGEVKSLAGQVRSATDRIASEINSVQAVSNDVVASLAAIGASISKIREYVTGTASAVEEQSAVTKGISADMLSTAENVAAINDNMAAMTAAVVQVDAAVGATREAVKILAR